MGQSNEMLKYQWIVDKLKKIKGVEQIAILKEGAEVFMFLTNNMTGAQKKEYNFPLRTHLEVEYTHAGNVPHNYDIMDLDDPQSMVEVVHAKAYQFFNNATVH